MNVAWWLSWVIQVPVLFGTFCTGSPKRGRVVILLGWLLLLFGQVGYFVFGLVARQYGFLLSSSIFAMLAVYGWWQWRGHSMRQEAQRQEQRPHRHVAVHY